MPSPHPLSSSLTLKIGLLMTLALIDATCIQAEEVAQTDLTIARLFSGKEFTPQDPGKIVWCPRSTTSYLTLIEIAGPKPKEPTPKEPTQ